MTDQLPSKDKDDAPLEVTKYPQPLDQQLADAVLRDPLTSPAEHLQQLTGRKHRTMNAAKAAAWKRLQKPEVQEYMRVQQERIRRAADLEGQDLLQMLVMIMRTDITQIAEWDEEGRLTFKPMDQLPMHARRAVKKVKQRVSQTKFGETVTTEIEMYDHLDAIKLFSEIAGIKGTEGTGIQVQNGVIYLNAPQSESEALEGKRIYEG